MHLFCTQVHLIFITRSNITKKKNINNNRNYFSYLANFFALSSNVRFKMIAKSRNLWRNFAKPRKKEQFEVHCHMLYVIYYAHSYQAVSSPFRPMSITLTAQLSKRCHHECYPRHTFNARLIRTYDVLSHSSLNAIVTLSVYYTR